MILLADQARMASPESDGRTGCDLDHDAGVSGVGVQHRGYNTYK